MKRLEQQEHIRILYACESDSRAWGFASQDSDYDVCFIYVRPLNWYLSLEKKRNVLEEMLPNDLELAGWDVTKALTLFAKSNPPMLEWLDSPIVYYEEPGFTEALKALLPTYYAPRACMYHYLHMAKSNRRDYLKGETVWTKKYLYVLRPVLACEWIAQGHGPVPMAMQALVDTLLEGERHSAIQTLIERKRRGDELAEGPRLPVLDALIDETLERLQDAPETQAQPKVTIKALDALFVDTLERYAPRQVPG